jgi:hypothetical protein
MRYADVGDGMRTLGLLFLVLAATVALAPASPAEAEHGFVFCGISFRGPDRQRDLQGVTDLPVAIQQIVAQHIADRLGSQYAASLVFDRGQLKNLDSPTTPDPASDPLARRLYNLIYQFRLSPDQSVTACILLEPNGNLVQPLSLPAWAHGAAPPRVVTAVEAKSIARKQDVPDSAEVELRYFPDTDTLEWLFSTTTGERGPSLWGKTLHIPVQNPAGIHWSKWDAIR